MGSLGLPEIIFIFLVALLIFGPKKLPELGRTLGRGVAEFRRATDELKRSINTELALDETPVPPVLRTSNATTQSITPVMTAHRPRMTMINAKVSSGRRIAQMPRRSSSTPMTTIRPQ